MFSYNPPDLQTDSAEAWAEKAEAVSTYVQDIWRGQLARINHVSSEGAFVSFDYASGESGYATGVDVSDLTLGDIVLVDMDTSTMKKVPPETWQSAKWVGVVRHRGADRTLIEVGPLLRSVPTSGVSYEKDATVLATEHAGVLELISADPIRPVLQNDDEASLSIDHLRVKPEEMKFSFDDFGGLEPVVSRAKELIELQLEKRAVLREIGVRPIKGVLFTGLPGTGKTMLASIIAREAGAAFYLVSGPQIVSKWHGESEALLRKLFDDAGEQDRSIIFFDEIDSLAGQRENAHEASGRVVATFLTEMDGFERDQNIVVIAATNRPDDLDPALRRPGRFDWTIDFPEPSEEDRVAILQASGRDLKRDPDLPLRTAAADMHGWSSAAVSAVWTEAGLLAAEDSRARILVEDFVEGVDRVRRQLAMSRSRNADPRGQG